VIASHQQVVRIDRERLNEIPKAVLGRLTDVIESHIKEVDAVIIEDYGKGVITPAVIKKAVSAAKRFKKIITIDPKEEHFGYYRGVTALTPNRYEAQAMVGFKIKDEESLKKAGQAIVKKLNCEMALITLGEDGMSLFEKGQYRPVSISTVAQEVFDVSGAGDTVISAFTLSLCSGATNIEAAHIANCAAGVVVGKVGVAVVSRAELLERMEKIIRS
jgi:D-beta-D-heptose 7-phosphate kinase/D-beta-D-heptose 1-phosphate adenosyltransferase